MRNLSRLREKYSSFLYRVLQFGGVSFTGLALENVMLFVLMESLGFELILGKLVGAETSIALMFVLNNRYTFRNRPEATLRRFIRSNIVRAGGILIALVVLKIGVALGFWYIAANTVGIVVGFFFNYALESLYTWSSEGYKSKII